MEGSTSASHKLKKNLRDIAKREPQPFPFLEFVNSIQDLQIQCVRCKVIQLNFFFSNYHSARAEGNST